MRALLAIAISAMSTVAMAQTSAGYKLTEFTLNGGGRPANGSIASSASYRIKLDAIGDTVAATGLSSASHHLDDGFVSAYPPPGEVRNERWTGKTVLSWDPEGSVGTYEVYRDLMSSLPGSFGACFQSPLLGETATDVTSPASGTAWFYLVTARQPTGLEGSMGADSLGVARVNGSPCP